MNGVSGGWVLGNHVSFFTALSILYQKLAVSWSSSVRFQFLSRLMGRTREEGGEELMEEEMGWICSLRL